jgi:hypothetical protein
MPNVTRTNPKLTIDQLDENMDYKFRFTPMVTGVADTNHENSSSPLSLILDIKMPTNDNKQC